MINLIAIANAFIGRGLGMLGAEPEVPSWVTEIADAIYSILWPVLIVVVAAGTIYSIVLGVNMARADSTEKREEAKKRLINVIVGIAITVALILLFQLLLRALPELLGDVIDPNAGGGGTGGGSEPPTT